MSQPLLSRLYKARQAAHGVPVTSWSAPPQVVVICNQKGGCGKTTTAINLAAGLGLKGYPSLLIDLDPQAHASLGLGFDVEHLSHTMYDLFQDRTRLFEEIIQPTRIQNLWLAPANHLLAGAQLELATVPNREHVLRQVISRLPTRFRFLVIDCSPSLNLLTINALAAADFCLIPLQPHYFALEGMKELFMTIELIHTQFNSRLEVLGILPMCVDRHARITRELLGQIRDYFHEQVTATMVRFSAELIEASIVGQPVFLYAPRSDGAKDYAELTEELFTRMSRVAAASPGNDGAPA